MKKITIFLIVLFMFSLSGCKNNDHLTNDYFENEKSDDIEVLMDIINEYDAFIHDNYNQYLGTTYPRQFGSVQGLNDYVLYDQNEKIYKDDMINYDLTDNRSYLIEYSDIQYYLYESRITAYCDDIKEGIKCYDDKELYYLLYYVDGNEAYVEYSSVVNGYTVHLEKMYYYTNELEEKVFEYTHQAKNVDEIDYKYITKTTLIEDVGEVSYTCSSCNVSERTGWLDYSSVSFTNMSRKYIYQGSNDAYLIKFLNGVTNEFYWGIVNDDVSNLIVYEVYRGHIKLVEMNPINGTFIINLNALDGWSYIEESETPRLYHIYDENEILIDNLLVGLAVTEGDFVFYEYEGASPVPDDILNMSTYGLEAPYSMEYYLNQKEYFDHVYPLLLDGAHMDRTFEMSYDYFMKMLDIE
ncbi:hypothetical protein BK010_09395 [Tenericutes bacterium MO-XQ]|nr:hypothetical protein BK010_09395 [Tenericutes bacterium MO-XQ]